MEIIEIHFIINPIAGKGTTLPLSYIAQFFSEKEYKIIRKESLYKKHASILTQESVNEKADIVVACGGDGTINEVASALLGSEIPLGILRLGSGNGLASNLNIPKKIEDALELLKKPKITRIDVGHLNHFHFFSNAGLGFDAMVIKNYESSKRRTLFGYLEACLTSFRDINQNQRLKVEISNKKFELTPFMIFISNSNEMGYNFSLTPQASLKDGLLDVLVISKIGKLKMLWLGILLLVNKPSLLKEAAFYRTKNLFISKNGSKEIDVQIDGEVLKINQDRISIGIDEHILKVIVPK